ncbi:MAG TPA: transcriptional regulator [Trichocoleus sp.]
MNESTKEKVVYSASEIFALWREYPRRDLEPPYSTAVAILDELAGAPRKLSEVAEALDINQSTVSEYINAMKNAGVPIIVDSISNGSGTGRDNSTYYVQE